MRAAEDERINSRLDQRLQILFDDTIRDRAFQPAFFDQRDEEGQARTESRSPGSRAWMARS